MLVFGTDNTASITSLLSKDDEKEKKAIDSLVSYILDPNKHLSVDKEEDNTLNTKNVKMFND